MYLQLFGTVVACNAKFFTDKIKGTQVNYFESGINTKEGFVVLTSIDLREVQGKSCVFKVLAKPHKLATKSYTLKIVDMRLAEGGEEVVD